MSETGNREKDQPLNNHQVSFLSWEEVEERVVRVLDERARKVQLSPALHAQIIQNLPRSRGAHPARRRLVLACSLACALVVVLGLVFGIAHVLQSAPGRPARGLVFQQQRALPTPTQLEQEGAFLSLDPTGQYLVYGIAGQVGVMYTTSLASPVADNRLAMENARDISWAPDGSALVTTIYPSLRDGPQLALVPIGQYMHVLGKRALASAWLPTSPNAITYITQADGQATLWQITPQGQNAHILVTFPLPFLVQRLVWSPDARYLAILTAADPSASAANIQGASRALFLFDTRSGSLRELVAPGAFTLESPAWSPNGHILSYEQRATHGSSVLVSFDATANKALATIPLRGQLQGLSWSPNSRDLVYSDGGTFRTYSLDSTPIVFPHLAGRATYPLWLDSRHLLYLAHTENGTQLTQLAAVTSS
jgi:hypothetical protein